MWGVRFVRFFARSMKPPALRYLSDDEIRQMARQHRSFLMFVVWYFVGQAVVLACYLWFASQAGSLTQEAFLAIAQVFLAVEVLVHLGFLVALSVKSYRLLSALGVSMPFIYTLPLWFCLPLGLVLIHLKSRNALKHMGCEFGYWFAKRI